MFEFFFFWKAFMAGLGIVAMTGPLGCFILWRRMVFLGDTLAHAALLGVAFALILDFNMIFTVFLVCTAIAFVMTWLQEHARLAIDTSLGLISYGALALGMVLFAKRTGPKIDPSHYLFGDILLISTSELVWIASGVVFVATFLFFRWRKLLLWTISPELAHTLNIPVRALQLQFTVLLALVVALTLKIAGVLLAPALLIIPAASMAMLASSPGVMVVGATLFALLMFLSGFSVAWIFDLPVGPAIILAGIGLFGLVLSGSCFYKRQSLTS